jgi:hypothetical protein
MVGRVPAMIMAASSSTMASVSSYSGREARSLAAARWRRTDGLKRPRSTQVAISLARARDTIGPCNARRRPVRAEVVAEANGTLAPADRRWRTSILRGGSWSPSDRCQRRSRRRHRERGQSDGRGRGRDPARGQQGRGSPGDERSPARPQLRDREVSAVFSRANPAILRSLRRWPIKRSTSGG